MADTLDATAAPGETIRSDGRAPRGSPLPTISVDLRSPPQTPLPSSSDLEVRGVIGEGGMGRVLLARQRSLQRDVAVKTVKPDATESARSAIVAEGVVTGQLEHPSIVPIHALGLDPSGLPALVMKRVEGVTWQKLLENPSHPGWEGWEGTPADRLMGHLQILESVCNALHFAHSRGVVHRDVKPQNVLIGGFGDVYLADWGVAGDAGTLTSAVCGTPAFLAPEMAAGTTIDARTDVYLLGASLHLILTGRHRHPGSSVPEALQHAAESPPFAYSPEVPVELAALANRSCHLDPAQRPASAREFRDALKTFTRHRDAVALGTQAAARLAELIPLAAKSEPTASERERLERLLAEARFGLEQSLAQWPDNAGARAALERVEALVAERTRAALELERQARLRDPKYGMTWRFGALGVAAVVATLGALGSTRAPERTPQELVRAPALILLALTIAAVALRRQLVTTRFNRDAMVGVYATVAAMTLSRALGLWMPVPQHVQVAHDAMLLALGSAVVAIPFLRWAWLAPPVFAIASIVCALYPDLAQAAFAWSVAAAIAIPTFLSWLARRR